VLQYHFNWKVLSAIAGITWWNFYFQLYQSTIRAPQVVDFLTHLLRHLPGRLLVIWDRSKTHRSHLVAEFVAGQRGRVALDYLPAYAPELNPVEYIWGYWKHHELLTSARMTSASSAITLDTRCDGCAAGPRW
jgi:transposase